RPAEAPPKNTPLNRAPPGDSYTPADGTSPKAQAPTAGLRAPAPAGGPQPPEISTTLKAGLQQAQRATPETFSQLPLCNLGRQLLSGLYRHPNPTQPFPRGLYRQLEIETLRTEHEGSGAISQLRWLLSTAPMKALNRSVRGDTEHAEARRDYLAGVVLMMWAVVGDGAKEGKLVARGSFKIVDPDQRLFQCLQNYVKLATGQEDPGFLTNDFAYLRSPDYPILPLSSHYKTDPLQYGIDVRFQGGDSALPALPGDHSHILFGQVHIENTPYTFIKLEEVGLGTVSEAALHSMHFLNSGTVDKAQSFREKDLHPQLVSAYSSYCQAMNLPAEAKTIYGMWSVMKEAPTIEPPHGEALDNEDDWELVDPKRLQEQQAEMAQQARETFLQAARDAGIDHALSIQTGQEVVLDYATNPPEGSRSAYADDSKGWEALDDDFVLVDSED
ncbi:MAG: hypothetical protein VX699_00660, partial [Myxococcota bacterium]|nr:hypothetical protein [Myxococcota bacterium]